MNNWNDYVTSIQSTRDETAITDPTVGQALFAAGVVTLTVLTVAVVAFGWIASVIFSSIF